MLAVGYTTDGKAQCTSLEDGNVAFVYATGADFAAGVVQEGPVFLKRGEIYVFTGVQNGSIITFSEGGYGFSGQVNGNDESPMPLLSLGLSFTDTFFFGFRDSENGAGFVRVVNGPVATSLTLFDGADQVQLGQQDIELDPWEATSLNLNGNKEYRLIATNPVMACIHAEMNTNRFYDSRLIMPLTNDGMTWPRSGFMSAPYNNTVVDYYVRDGATSKTLPGAPLTVTPGSPVDIDANQPTGTGASDSDYEPNGATRFRAAGLVSAYSGADSAGLEATPMWPTQSCVQRVALPLQILNVGDGGDNGIAVMSPHEGTFTVYEWDPGLEEAVAVYVDVPLTRGGAVTIATPDDQNFPASALLSANAAESTVQLTSVFYGGYLEADVPVHVVFNAQQNQNGGTSVTRKGTGGSPVIAINADDDEQASTGSTPETSRTELRQATNGFLYKRTLTQGATPADPPTESWVLA